MRIFWGRKISKYQKKLLSCEKSAKSFELTLKKDIYLGYSGDTPKGQGHKSQKYLKY
jgi:hypothetical protein